jgi:hypothetical protein
MRAKKRNTGKLIKISETTLLSLVADRLKDRVLFPEKVEEARKYIKSIKVSPF